MIAQHGGRFPFAKIIAVQTRGLCCFLGRGSGSPEETKPLPVFYGEGKAGRAVRVYGQSRVMPMFPAVLPRRTKIARQEMHLAGGRRASGPASRKNFFMDGNEPGQPGKSSMRLRCAHPWLCLKMNVARFIWRGKFSKVSLRGRPSPVAKPSPWHRSLFFPG